MMVTDVSTAFTFEPALNPPSPFAVTAPSFGYDHDFDNLELPFLELSPTSPALSDVWRDIEDEVVDSDLFYGACADIERLLAEMSSAANPGDDGGDPRFIRPKPMHSRSLRSSSLEPGKAPVVPVSASQGRRGSASDLVPGLVPVVGRRNQDPQRQSMPTTSAASTLVLSAGSDSVVTSTASASRRTRSSTRRGGVLTPSGDSDENRRQLLRGFW